MREYISIGPSPSGEDCVQVGSPDYETKARKECTKYIQALRAHYGNEPPGAHLKIKSNPHDFGSYYDVVCYYNTHDEEATSYAFKVEEGLEHWPKELMEFAIIVEKIPGDKKSEEHFSYECFNEDQAWDYARSKWRMYGPSSRVKSVTRIKPQQEIEKIPVTKDRVMEAVNRQHTTLDNPGFCLSCGYEQDDCEPDARDRKCENCGEMKVFGAEEVLMMIAI